jgi:hypothetical protein
MVHLHSFFDNTNAHNYNKIVETSADDPASSSTTPSMVLVRQSSFHDSTLSCYRSLERGDHFSEKAWITNKASPRIHHQHFLSTLFYRTANPKSGMALQERKVSRTGSVRRASLLCTMSDRRMDINEKM